MRICIYRGLWADTCILSAASLSLPFVLLCIGMRLKFGVILGAIVSSLPAASAQLPVSPWLETGYTTGLATYGYVLPQIWNETSEDAFLYYDRLLLNPNATGSVQSGASRQYGAKQFADPDRRPDGTWTTHIARLPVADDQFVKTVSLASFQPSDQLRERVMRNESNVCLFSIDSFRIGRFEPGYTGDCTRYIDTPCLDEIARAASGSTLFYRFTPNTTDAEGSLIYECPSTILLRETCLTSTLSSFSFKVDANSFDIGVPGSEVDVLVPAAAAYPPSTQQASERLFPPNGTVRYNTNTGEQRDFVSLNRFSYAYEPVSNFTTYDNYVSEVQVHGIIEIDPRFQIDQSQTLESLREQIRNGISLTCHTLDVTEGSRLPDPELIANASRATFDASPLLLVLCGFLAFASLL